MRMLGRLALFVFAASAPLMAQTVTVRASQFGGLIPATGTLYWSPVDAKGQPLSYQLGSGGQALNSAVQIPVVDGAFSATLPDTNLTNPQNVCFKVTFAPKSGGQPTLGPGYSCVQPASSNAWCTAGVCVFDNYVPTTSPLALVQPPVGTVDGSGGPATVTVSAAHFGGIVAATGTLYWAPVDANGQPLSYELGSGGQAINAPLAVPVVNGVFAATLPNTNLTNPQNVCFKVTFESPPGGVQRLSPGYSCVQPAATNSWCTAAACNFDNYAPNTPALAPAAPYVVSVNGQSGVVVISGSSVGDSDVTGQTASQGTVNLVGTVASSGKYRISYYIAQHTLCATGSNAVQLTFRWTDASSARSANTLSLTLGPSQSPTSGSIQGVIPVYALASSAITYTSTVTGACTTGGPSSYDAHIAVESIQ